MLLDTIFLRDDHVILRDVDGSELSLTASDAINIHTWLHDHYAEIARIVVRQIRTGRKEEEKEGQMG